jgi:hypothetical protein
VAQASAAGVNVDPNELSAALMTGANMAYTWVKDWRDKKAAPAPVEPPKP